MSLPLFALLAYAILTIWIDSRIAWAVFQLGVFALVLARALRWRGGLVRPAIPLAAAVLWILAQIALHWTASSWRTSEAALNWFTWLLTFLLAADSCSDPHRRRRLLEALTLFGMGLSLVAILQLFMAEGRVFWLFPSGYNDGVLGPFVNRNQFAAWIELLLAPALYLSLTDCRRRALFATAVAVMLTALVAGASRAGSVIAFLEIAAVLAVAAARQTAPKRTIGIAAVQVAIFASAGVAIAGWQNLWGRFTISATERLRPEAIRASLEMLRDHPLTGSGLGTWSMIYPRYAAFDAGVVLNQAHNDWVQWAAEGGLPFVLLIFIFAALSCKPAIRSIYGLGTVAFLLHAFVDYPMQQRPGLAAWFFAMSGAAIAWRKRDAATHDGLLRGTRNQPQRQHGRDPSGVPPTHAGPSSGPLPG